MLKKIFQLFSESYQLFCAVRQCMFRCYRGVALEGSLEGAGTWFQQSSQLQLKVKLSPKCHLSASYKKASVQPF